MRQVHFSEFTLDAELFQLTKHGQPIEIGPRALDLLVYLIENRDRVVDLEELRRAVWASAALSRSSIPTCICELRTALGDDAAAPQSIETVRGRGYRFIGSISAIKVDDPVRRPTPASLPFVGRELEMEVMKQRLQVVTNEARCQLILLRGEAGIGKTRLLGEFVAGQNTRIPSYIAKTPGIEGAPGFWPWTQILREAVAEQGQSNVELLTQAKILSTIFPEIHDDADLTNNRSVSLDRFSIMSQWARAIRSIAKTQPVLLAFEDIHRADVDTLTLLSWICDELENDPVFIVVTMRPRATTDLGAARISELTSNPICTYLDIGPLTASEIEAMLDPLIDDRSTLGQALRYRTSGNAFYVTHLIRHLGRKEITTSAEIVVQELPPNPREIVAHQLSDLPQRTRTILSAASIAGGQFDASTIARMLGISPEDLIHHLDPAERAWFIVADGPSYVFTHSLLRDALYSSIGSAKRRSLHLTLAHTLQAQSGASTRTAEIAEHLLTALPLGNPEDACKFSLEAGREASARFAHSKAQTFFRTALETAEDAPSTSAKQRCEIMLELAGAQLYDGDRDGAYSTLQEAAHLARTHGHLELLAACALQLAPDFLAIEIGSFDSRLVAMLRESLSGLPDDAQSLHAQLLARLSHALLWSRDAQDAEQLAIEALRVAKNSRDATALSAALAARADSLAGPDRLEERMAVTKQLQQTVRAKNYLPDSMMQHVRLIATLLEIGDVRAVDTAIASCETIASDMNVSQYLWYPLTFKAMRKLMQGDFPQAQLLATQSYERGDRQGDENVGHSRACQMTCVLIEQEQAALALPVISRMALKRPLVRAWAAGTGYINLMLGNHAEAKSTLDSFDASEIQLLFRELGGSAGVAFLAEIATRVGDMKTKSFLYDLCCTAGVRSATLGFAIAYFGCFSRYAGLLADSLGLRSEALEHLRTAVRTEDHRGAALCRAHTALDLSRVIMDYELEDKEARDLIYSAERASEGATFIRLAARIKLLRERVVGL